MEKEEVPVAIIGIGAIEQHGTHLPLGTDSLGVREFIHEVASRTNSVCVHPCWPGYSPHHMEFPGKITFSWDTLLGFIMDTIGSLAYHGIKRIVLFNHHGGNSNIMSLASQLAKREYNLAVATPSGPSDTEFAKEIQRRMKKHFEVHSGPRETAYALHYFPELVEMWRLEEGENGIILPEELQEFMDPDRDDYELVSQIFNASLPPNTDEITTTGQYAVTDPRKADPEESRKRMGEVVDFMVKFIKQWKEILLSNRFD